jgi:hypothetical protein
MSHNLWCYVLWIMHCILLQEMGLWAVRTSIAVLRLEDRTFLGCDALSQGGQFSAFQRIVLSLLSHTCWHSIISFSSWILRYSFQMINMHATRLPTWKSVVFFPRLDHTPVEVCPVLRYTFSSLKCLELLVFTYRK